MYFTTTHLNHPYHVAWGQYEFLHIEEDYRVKKLRIKDEQCTSYHHHRNREGYFTVVQGIGEVALHDEPNKVLKVGDTISIPKRKNYSLRGLDNFVIIEVQIGECDELDTYREGDKYGRPLEYLKDRVVEAAENQEIRRAQLTS